MSFLEVLLLFLCFVFISFVLDLLKLHIQSRMMVKQQRDKIDALFVSVIRGIMQYRLDAIRLFKGDDENV